MLQVSFSCDEKAVNMKRVTLAEQYETLHKQAEEKTAEWYVYGFAWAYVGGSGAIDWVLKEIWAERNKCERLAREHPYCFDAQYGTYDNYMRTKVRLYDAILREVLICKYESLMEKTVRKSMRYSLYQIILSTLENQPMGQAGAFLREQAFLQAKRRREVKRKRTRKLIRQAATIYALAVLDLGGVLLQKKMKKEIKECKH